MNKIKEPRELFNETMLDSDLKFKSKRLKLPKDYFGVDMKFKNWR